MYFLTSRRDVYHVLSDERTGDAPCGARLSRVALVSMKSGKHTPQLAENMPDDARLCKHCEKHQTP